MTPSSPSRPRVGLLLALASLSAACVDPLALGSVEADGVLLSESDNLAHLAVALGEDLSLAELFERGDAVDVAAAPDPTELLLATAALDDERSEEGVALRILTQNVALLDAKLLGFVDYARTPLLDERRAELLGRFLRDEPDLVLLQEVWVAEDLERFTATAEAAGYLAFPGTREGHNDGLLTLVKAALVADEGSVERGAVAYQKQDGLEHFPGPGIKRGYQWVRFEHPELGTVVAANTHMQAFPNMWHNRMSQGRELGIAVADLAADGVAFVGGDLNAGPYYRSRSWTLPDDTVDETWWNNAFSYPVLLEYGGLSDLAVMGRPTADAASDVTLGDTVVNAAARALEVPGAAEGWCAETPHTTFTASDCNTLYFDQYGGTEYPARLDHLHVRDPSGRVKVSAMQIVFTEQETFGDVETEPSDHYGVQVDVVVAAP